MHHTRYRYAIIGTGRSHGGEGATGFGMAHPHYKGFTATNRVDLVAVADNREEAARLFLLDYSEDAKIYTDYYEMLREETPDIVSITTWPHLHAEMTVAACEAGVKAVHCEKPMATTWGDAKRMFQQTAGMMAFDHLPDHHVGPGQQSRTPRFAGVHGCDKDLLPGFDITDKAVGSQQKRLTKRTGAHFFCQRIDEGLIAAHGKRSAEPGVHRA